jgi:prepilin-type N-terminal cleavage/methylation domain-containing protein
MKTRRYKYGLSLVEMLIVVGVIALLATMVIGIAGRIDNQSKEKGIESTFALLEGALEEYKEFVGHFPYEPVDPNFNSATELAAIRSENLYRELYSKPGSRKILEKISGSLIKHDVDTGIVPPVPEIYDPWGTPLDYRYVPGDNFPELVSAGPDETFGTADDIKNR